MKQALSSGKKNLISSLKLAFGSAMLLTASFGTSFAATGDILYQNCTDSSNCNGAGSNVGWIRTVETSGCYSGNCLKLKGVLNTYGDGDDYGAGSTSISTGLSGVSEITVSYYVKFDEAAVNISKGNIKQFIPYVGGSKRYGTVIIPHWGVDYYHSRVKGTFDPASWFTPATGGDYAIDNGDGTYYAHTGYTRGKMSNDGPIRPGTTWVKMTHYIKLPTSSTATDGVLKVWVNNELMLDFWNCAFGESGSSTSLSNLTFYSSSEAGEPFEHWMDEMVIYQGYVPPSGPIVDLGPKAPSDFKLES